ncbi:MAG: bifunctional diaminohydroxyphosphoribosylaminopyrimidine deaminase/5-amino-6-(5-phosphoribosylamino)uracil reductase RibD [Sedimenticola sp.]|uniref:Riboflavin biosynthesis protein RibD n=1 Tax=Sedimenticola thiotaurini TaxID=1543721 RepID=A0A558CV29_9GAMM|nr:bifunctional diaminohydroxyphosphoribosylaminopyrimidine deaminase/5-amino-6-(5-phosphoribosylamino)uracil reductase RibD [Sedimenticola sp.]MCW8881602.1 bifunctional diaminohydroxyphosphoribosylaminopyrimidine deaminase/5-amino-6-(5-phosphoribosylamino)uracil reductase RibD [Sedimenticola sp.]TVT52630.1 MAG: bifunctional diaminohydroxyphosphoribosylaminopyrimidine deaminase/5-amino-6-(5-phosphoribosylamino)uracil reductase RibD [Sedimenticola thiotaurini]
MSSDDFRYMARAIRLADLGRYTTHPNPRVGCVLVKDKRVVGEGIHRRAGEPHAERNALAVAGDQARGATAYVTLEPCCHHGRTPPCSDGLIEAGVSRVVVAMQDPNPKVAGEGIAQLQRAGIQVDLGVMTAEAMALNPGFIKRMTDGVPFVRCKLAMSMDGRTAMANGESKWITGEAARLDVQRLRARSDAIITGIGTVLADDPSMNVRVSAAELPGVGSDDYLLQPLRVVLDPELQMSAEARMLKLTGKTLIVTASEDEKRQYALESAGAEVVVLPHQNGCADLPHLLLELANRGINEVLIESGPTLAGAAVAAGVVDELVLYAAPLLMGSDARGLLNIPALVGMKDCIELEIHDLRMVGRDMRMTLHPVSNSITGS